MILAYCLTLALVALTFLVLYYGERTINQLKGKKVVKTFNDTIFSNRICEPIDEHDHIVVRRVIIKRKWADGRIEFITQDIVVQN